LTQRFPKIAASIDDIRAGLLHPEMAVFAHATEAAMLARETEVVRDHFDFAEELLTHAADDVDNAIYFSYLELLPFASAPWATKLLPPNLRRAAGEIGVFSGDAADV
jgi:hypothetical protein